MQKYVVENSEGVARLARASFCRPVATRIPSASESNGGCASLVGLFAPCSQATYSFRSAGQLTG